MVNQSSGQKSLSEFVRIGVTDYISNDSTIEELLTSIRSVRLTKRENEIIDLLSNNLSNPEIAQKLSISINTVKDHLSRIYRKLSLDSRQDIIAFRKRECQRLSKGIV